MIILSMYWWMMAAQLPEMDMEFTAIPAKVFIDKEGNLRYSAQGF